jgi:hypothetical protein
MLTEFDESEPVSDVINATFTLFAETPVALAALPAVPVPDPADPVDPAVVAVDAAVVAVEFDDLCELPQADASRATTPAATTKTPYLRRILLPSTAILPRLCQRAARRLLLG